MNNPRTPANPARRSALWAAAGGVVALQSGTEVQAVAPGAALPALPVLRRGFNLSHWFEYERAQDLTLAELRGLRHIGLDHVRIPLDPVACGWRFDQPQQLPFLPALQRALDDVLSAGLIAVLDLHPTPHDKAMLEADPALEAPLAQLWSALARSLAGLPTQGVVFQLLNEPQYYGLLAWRWPILQRRLLRAVRAEAPAHLVLMSGQAGGSLDGLLNLVPLAEPALAYSFNHYEPFLFTHQGVPWLDNTYTAAGQLQDVPYPAALQSVRPARLRQPSAAASQALAAYLKTGWNATQLEQRLAPAGAWARQHQVALVCSEFGVFRAGIDPAARHRWLADTRRALEAIGAGWTVWDYSDVFGLTLDAGRSAMAGRRLVAPEALAALGLLQHPGAFAQAPQRSAQHAGPGPSRAAVAGNAPVGR